MLISDYRDVVQTLLSPLLEFGNGKGVKDSVLTSLSHEWPLTVRKLHHTIERRGMSISYHAVHKACQQLVSQGILKREKVGYLISMDWISRASQLLDDMKKNYVYNKPIFLRSLSDFKQDGDTQTFVFENLADADAYRKRLQSEFISNNNGMPYCGVARHLRSPIVLSEKTIDATSTVRRTQIPCYIIVNGNTIPDEWCADYYRHEGVNVKTGVDCAKTCEMMIMGDIVTQIYIPEDIQQQVKSIYSGVRSMAAISVPDFYRIVYQKHIAVKFTVMRNHEIASQMREQIMENFR